MVDIVSTKKRSQMMAGIKGKNTKPELLIRKALHKKGFRYKLHDKSISGKPDIIFPKYKSLIFINGCFWHGHDCHLFKWPSSRPEFWKEKITKNKERDRKNYKILSSKWRVLVIWECSLKGKHKIIFDELIRDVILWLQSEQNNKEITGHKGT